MSDLEDTSDVNKLDEKDLVPDGALDRIGSKCFLGIFI